MDGVAVAKVWRGKKEKGPWTTILLVRYIVIQSQKDDHYPCEAIKATKTHYREEI